MSPKRVSSMSASSDGSGLFPQLICGRCGIYSNNERYGYNNIKFLYFVLGLLWECEGITF